LGKCINAEEAGGIIATGKSERCYKGDGLVDFCCVVAAVAAR